MDCQSQQKRKRIKRSEEIQKTIIVAMEVPLKTMMCCLYLLEQIRELIGITNPNLISDVGVATYMADAAFQSAKLNVEANLSMIKNQYLVEKVQHEISHAEKKARLFFHRDRRPCPGKIKEIIFRKRIVTYGMGNQKRG